MLSLSHISRDDILLLTLSLSEMPMDLTLMLFCCQFLCELVLQNFSKDECRSLCDFIAPLYFPIDQKTMLAVSPPLSEPSLFFPTSSLFRCRSLRSLPGVGVCPVSGLRELPGWPHGACAVAMLALWGSCLPRSPCTQRSL